ncbi:MAG: hypothetical protein K9N11_03535 [Lentisphaeria bacterium]|nr:hypothetical protein [Candidatus Neomarinimicrobiota bacterium]MCF7841907.1 hypothetical protein [Lentisphaeria bacterium]
MHWQKVTDLSIRWINTSGMRNLLLVVGFCAGLQLIGQENVYRQAYLTAMADSVITADEQKILDGLRISLELTEDEVMEINRSFVMGDTTQGSVNHEGRYQAIGLAMVYGNGLYGFGIPYVLNADELRTYLGFQGVMLAAGFYYAWDVTKNLDLPQSRVAVARTGALLGTYSTLVLTSMVGFDRWFEFDDDGKLMVTYAMIAAPLGLKFADRLYQKWQPSNGLAQLMSTNTFIGAYNGFTTYNLLSRNPDDLEHYEAYNRGIFTFSYGGALLGFWGTQQLLNQDDVTGGDAIFYASGSLAGAFTAQRLITYFDIDYYKDVLALSTLLVDGGMYATYHLGRHVNLSRGDAAIIVLGGGAGYSLLRGAAYLLDEMDAEIIPLLDIVALLGGGYGAFRYLVNAPDFRSGVLDQTDIRIYPTLLTMGEKSQTGLGLEVRW